MIIRKKILHLAPDEKFINRANQIFKLAFPNVFNEFYIIKSNGEPPKFVSKGNNVFIIDISENNHRIPIFNVIDYEYVFFHYWLSAFTPFVLENRNFKKFIWIIWGADLYNSASSYELYGKYTKKYVDTIKLLGKIKRFVFLKSQDKKNTDSKYKAINLLYSVAVGYKEEFDAFKSIIGNNKVEKYIRFFYYPLEFMDLDTTTALGSNILIGNSATPTNNHMEVFRVLKQIKLNDRKVVVPLSYGDKRYGKIISIRGRLDFGANFSVQTSFMPLRQYNILLKSCGIVVMNHYRQQAVGNIISSLYGGAKVYLNHRSSVFKFLKNIGIVVFSFEDEFTVSNLSILTPLTLFQINNNRRILKECFSLKIVISNLMSDLNIKDES